PTPEPTAKPEPTSVPVPTAKPEPTTAPVPTVKPEPTSTPVPTTVPEPTKSPEAVNDIPDGTQIFINYPYAYLYGYDYGAVGGEDTIKREEACSLLYRLLKQDNQLYGFDVNCSSVFEDLVDTNWAKNALMYMNYIGVYNDKIVQPTQEITRGEVAKIITFALKIHPDDSKQIKLDDLDKTNEYYYYIKALVDNGIMEGYNGKIKPAAKLTRAEYVTILNRVLGRDKRYDISNIEPIYPDLQDKSYWAYEDLMRASFGFSDEKVDGVYPIDPNRKHEREDIDFD
ncbi:MAG: S-layer homology domain-containing protein, partial [Oscillospiraceae bacterium]